MHTIGGRCPVCGEGMYLERLRCQNCGTALEGAFALSPLFELNGEQIRFVETLVKHQGNIQRVAEEMGISYRTARSRMDEIATALGFALPPEEARLPSPERRQEILESVEAGRLTSEQAVRLLRGEEE
jgi:hypothetical protein